MTGPYLSKRFITDIFLILVLSTMWASEAYSLAITLNPNSNASWLRYVAFDFGSSFADIETPVSVPVSASDTATLGASQSALSYSLSNSAFSIDVNEIRGSDSGDGAWSYANIFFSVDTNTDYTLSGFWNASDPGSTGQNIKFNAGLGDITSSTTLADFSQESLNTANEAFLLGGSGGDFNNLTNGSLTGTLIAGNEYVLSYFFLLTNESGTQADPASAMGNLTLSFNVPEPGSLLLLLSGMLGLSSCRKKKGGP